MWGELLLMSTRSAHLNVHTCVPSMAGTSHFMPLNPGSTAKVLLVLFFFFFLIYSCFLEQKSRFHCPVYFLTHFTLLCTCLCSHLSCVRLFLLCPRPLPFPPCCESLSCSKSLAPSGRPPSTRSLFPDCCLVHRTEPSLSLHLALQWDSLPAQLELLWPALLVNTSSPLPTPPFFS